MPNETLRVPAWCPICGGLMKGQRSTFSYYDYGCCEGCKIYWLEDRPDRITLWMGGWRPSPEEVQRKREAFED